MIAKIQRGTDAHDLIYYLYGPGRANEHHNPHLVASWDDVAVLEPRHLPDGRYAVSDLVTLLMTPTTYANGVPDKPVWHCSVRAAPEDPRLSDEQWQEIAAGIVAGAGIAPHGDDGACRWVAVRHADDHIHIAAVLARQDGAPVRLWRDYPKVRQVCRQIEDRIGLRSTAPIDGTGTPAPSRAEQEKAIRLGHPELIRDTLRREVRLAAAGSTNAEAFLAKLKAAGLLVRERRSEAGELTGYAVAWPGDRTKAGTAVHYSGGKLASDLTLPKLERRWETADADGGAGGDRSQLLAQAVRHAREAAEQLPHLSDAESSAIARAAGEVLTSVARLAEGRRSGPATQAADDYTRAARPQRGLEPSETDTSRSLRGTAKALSTAGRLIGDQELAATVETTAALITLAAAVARWHERGNRAWQHQAAVRAASSLSGYIAEVDDQTRLRHLDALTRALPAHAESIRKDPAAPALWAVLARAEAGGTSASNLLGRVAQRELDSADSPARVLIWRVLQTTTRTAPQSVSRGKLAEAPKVAPARPFPIHPAQPGQRPRLGR